MVNGGTVNNWICVNFSRNVKDVAVRDFCQELAHMCMTSGMVCTELIVFCLTPIVILNLQV